MATNESESTYSEDTKQFISSNDESLFARDTDGQLIRVVSATTKDFDTVVTLIIDGHEVKVKRALALRNSQGVIQRNELGEAIPRPTTIYDAVSQHYVNKIGDVNPIPTLCHREHLAPVGVCRVCLVEVQEKRASGRARTAFVPSCTYHVKEGMVVTTINATTETETEKKAVDSLTKTIGVLLELLATEHLNDSDMQDIRQGLSAYEPNELKRLVARFVKPRADFKPRLLPSDRQGKRGQDLSSEMIAVNHDACILCQRCTRACVEVKENDVISRTGKGYATKISFDLDDSMLESSCVSCGECVISCPTDALTFRDEVVQRQVKKLIDDVQIKHEEAIEVMPIEELLQNPLFAGIPHKFLEFNGGACIRRRLKTGELLCRQGDYGATAFLIRSGKFEILFEKPSTSSKKAVPKHGRSSVKALWNRFFSSKIESDQATTGWWETGTDVLADDEKKHSQAESKRIYRDMKDVILGEMACLSRQPRGATIKAVEDSEVIEIGSNVLYMLQRNSASRKILNDAYRKYAMNSQLERLSVFDSLSDAGKIEASKMLADDVELMSVEPGQPIFREGDEGSDFFLVRIGYVKISRMLGSKEQVINYIGPGNAFGEIGALSKLYESELDDDLQRLNYQVGKRTAFATALDHVELVRIKSSQLKAFAENNPDFKQQLLDRARVLLELDSDREIDINEGTANFVHQGLYNAQSLLVLDLESCTRCDECTRACADSHEGESRLVREGLRFGNFLVATSCRSCTDPYCLVGCPVNAIHREGSKEITIRDNCIGCGLCSSNCPYGNITMYGHAESIRTEGDVQLPIIRQKATTCDQCKSIGGDPRCVYACPHHAAHRMTGEELKKQVMFFQ